jgi:hypothetical protein
MTLTNCGACGTATQTAVAPSATATGCACSPTATPTSSQTLPALATSVPGGGSQPGTSISYPSPASGTTVNFGFTMTGGGDAKVRILNSGGSLLSEVSQRFSGGPSQLTVDISGYAFGIFYYQISIHYDNGRDETLPVAAFAVAH